MLDQATLEAIKPVLDGIATVQQDEYAKNQELKALLDNANVSCAALVTSQVTYLAIQKGVRCIHCLLLY